MCGIVGFYSVKFEENKKNIIASMLDVIKHRGPDDTGQWYSKRVSFGHVRLSIIDIINGKQPMQTQDGKYSLIFNGEIYNYIELRQLLVSKGYVFRTNSDTEVLLNMYIEFGPDCVTHLNGMFAFGIYDAKKGILFIARDHLGIKPLYYYTDSDSFVFASEVKALLEFPDITPSLNTEALNEYIRLQIFLGKETLFEKISILEPAHYLIVRNGEITEDKEYWSIDYSIDESKTPQVYVDELLILLENSMSLQLRSDVPVGSHLSGGLDSTIVSTLAGKILAGKINTFTGGFEEGAIYNECHYAKIASDYIGSEHFEVFPTPSDFVNWFEKLVYFMDYPCGGPGMFPQFMVSRLAKEKVKVVLGGQGGDEIFCGYARYLVAYLEQCLKSAINEEFMDNKYVVTLSSIIPSLSLLKNYISMIKAQFSSGLFEDMDMRYFKLINRSPNAQTLYNSDIFKDELDKDLFVKYKNIFNKPDTFSYINKMTYFDTKTLLPTLLHIEDRMSMAVSLESRVPLLDRRIVEFAAHIPPTEKFKEGKSKAVLLEAVKNIIPTPIYARKDKMGFPTPINEWFSGPLKNYLKNIILDKKTKERGIFNTAEIEHYMDRIDNFGRDLWGILNLEIWFRTFIDA